MLKNVKNVHIQYKALTGYLSTNHDRTFHWINKHLISIVPSKKCLKFFSSKFQNCASDYILKVDLWEGHKLSNPPKKNGNYRISL